MSEYAAADAPSLVVGRVAAIYRYPVRSMAGESLDKAELSKLGLVGDRAYSVFDPSDHAMASVSTGARQWKGLLQWRAAFAFEPTLDAEPPPITLTRSSTSGSMVDPDRVLSSDAEGFEQALAECLGRPARMWAGDTRGALASAAAEKRAIERGEGTGTADMPSVPYASAPIHLLTTASLAAASAAYPDGRFEVERFRPNVLIETLTETLTGAEGFVEKDWLQRRLRIGTGADRARPGVELSVFDETERCVATTHTQSDLPKDPRILRTIAENNRNRLGVYAGVSEAGWIEVGDPVTLLPRISL